MHKLLSFKSTLATFGTALIFAGVARGDFTPIALTPGSYTRDVVVENTAFAPLSSATTATTDGGTNNSGNTWYEIGYNTNNLTTGLPLHGSTVTDTNGGNHHYTMAPVYTTNNVIMVGHNNGGGTPVVSNGTFTLTTPATYTHLSFLNCSGNGAVPFNYVIHYADSSTESGGPVSSRDWFLGAAGDTATVYCPAGRMSVSGGGFANVGEFRAARLFFNDVAVGNTAVNITSVDIVYGGAPNNNGRAFIFAIAGSTDGGTVYNPVAVTGYSFDPVVEVGGPTNTVLAGLTSATVDNGTNNTGNTWYEQGYFARFPSSGLPPSGSTFTSVSKSNVQYTLASYAANNAALLDSSNITANVTPSSPAIYGGLSFLVSGANTPTPLQCILQFQDGTSETNAVTVSDWFNNAPFAWASFGRVNRDNRAVNNTPDQVVNPPLDSRTVINANPRLYDSVIAVTNTSSAITNILLVRTNAGGNQRSVVFAVSGAPVGNLPPVLASNPAGVKTWAVSNITLSATVAVGTGPFTYQWKKAPKGGGVNNVFDYSTFANVTDGGNISGSTSNFLTITNVQTVNSGDYILVASNPYGAATSSVATVTILSTNPAVTLPGDPIVAYQPNGGHTPGAETVQRAIDGRTFKYLNFGAGPNNEANPFIGPVGLIVTPQSGSSIVTSLRFTTANDASGRDPSDYTLEGSNDDGANWNIITGGLLKGTLALPTGRNNANDPLNPITQNVQEVDFANATGYKSYRVTFTNVYNFANNSSMQIGEVELLGELVPNPPVFTRLPAPTVTVFVGGSATFSVAAAGYPPPTYRWLTNGTPVLNATNTAYTFTNAQLADSGMTFSCLASNVFGSTNYTPATTLMVIPAPIEPYPVAVLADNPIAYWRLDEAPDNGSGNNGTFANDYRGGHNGTYSSSELVQAGYNPIVDTNTAVRFGVAAAADSYVGNIQDLSFGAPTNKTVNFSIEVWAKGPVQSTDAGIVTKGIGGGGEQFNLDAGANNPAHAFRFFFRDAGGATHGANGTAPLDSAWHHVVGVCDQANSTVALYVDGRLIGTGTASPSNGVLSSASPVSIGARQSAAGNFNNQFVGTLDDVAIYNYALSLSQVTNHYFAAQLPPYMVVSPTNTTINESNNAAFYSSAYGAPPLSYQWYDVTAGDPGTLLSGETSSNLFFFSVPASMSGYAYRVVVTNPYGSVTSPPTSGAGATLTVLSGPPNVITDVPPTLLVYAGRTATFAVAVGGTEPISYQWQSNGINMTDGGRVTGSHTNILRITNAQVPDTATYQVFMTNVGGGPISSSASALLVEAVPMLNTNGIGWGLNGTPSAATISGDVLTLSVGAGSTARSAFFNYPLYIGAFTASFTYQDVGGGGADGVTFVLQNDVRGTTALGAPGGSLGYSGITPSVALEFNIFGAAGIAFRTNGATGTPYAPTTPVNVAGGDPIDVSIQYGSGVVQVSLSNTVSAATFVTNYVVGNLATLVGADTATVGFTGSDGGVASTQQITKFKFIPYPVLGSQPVGGNVLLYWLASIGGYNLQSNTNGITSGSWSNVTSTVNQVGPQNQVTVPPANGSEFYRLALPVP